MVADNERLTELVEGAKTSAGASDKQFEKTMDSLTAKVNNLKNAYHEFIMGMLDSDLIKGGVDLLTGLFNVLNNLADLTGPLSGLAKVLMTVGMFMGGRNLVMSGVSAISGGLAAAGAAGTAAASGAGVTAAATAAATARQASQQAAKSTIGQSAKGLFAATFGGQLMGGLLSGGGNKASSNSIRALGQRGKDFGAAIFAGNKPYTPVTGAKQITAQNAARLNNQVALAAQGMGKMTPDLLYQAEYANLEAARFGTLSDKDADTLYNKEQKQERKREQKRQKQELNQKNLQKYKGKKGKADIATFFDTRTNALAQKGFNKTAGAVSKLGGALSAIGPLGIAAGAGIAAITAAMAINEHIEQKRIDNMNKLIEQHENATQTYNDNVTSLNALSEEYKTLSKEIDKNGKNVNLSVEQFERYQEIAQEIADISPEAVESVDIEGNVILKTDAIQEAMDALDYDMELEKAAFSSESGLETLISGIEVTTEDIKEKYTEAQNELSNLFADNALMLGDFNKGDFTDFRPSSSNYKVKGYAGTAVSRGEVKRDTSDLTELYKQRYQILKDAKESLTEIAEEYGTSSDEYKEAVSDYYSLQSLIDQGGQLQEELKAERAPIIESLKDFATSDQNLEVEGVQSLSDKISKDNEALFNKFIEDTGLNEDLSAAQMHDYVQFASEKLSGGDEFGNKLANEFDAITKAKDDFDEGIRDTEAVEEYNEAIEGSVENIESYIEELRNEGTAQAEALADSLETQLTELESYAQESKLTLSEAFNDMSDEIDEANKVKEKYDTATAKGDYYTGRQNFKEIYDDITSSINIAGGGSQSFWAGAELMLDQQWLRENVDNVDAVKAKIESLGPMMQDGAAGAQAFTDQLYDIPADELEEVGLTLNEAGEIDFENFRDENITALAEKLGLSVDFTTAMLNNLRQFSNVNFSNIDDVVRTMKQTGVGVETSSGKMAVSRSSLQKQSGMTLPEFEEWAGQKTTQEQIIMVDYQLRGKENLETFVSQMGEIAPTVFEKSTGGEGLEGTQVNLDDYIAASHMLGATQEEASDYLKELNNRGVEINGLEDGEGIDEAVEKGYETLDLADPLVGASNSMNNAAAAMQALVATLGGPYNEELAKSTKKQVTEKDEDFYNSGKKNGTVNDFQKWEDSDFERAQQDRETALGLQQQNQAAADKARAEGRTVDANKYQEEADLYGRRVGAIDNSIDQHDKYNKGEEVNINGKKYSPAEIDFLTKDREGKTSLDIESEYNRNRDRRRSTFSNDMVSYRDDVSNQLSTTGKLETIPDVAKTQLEIEIANEGSVEGLVDNIQGLEEGDHEVVIDALTAAAQGDVDGFNKALEGLPPEVQAQIISLLTGENPEIYLQDLEEADNKVITTTTINELKNKELIEVNSEVGKPLNIPDLGVPESMEVSVDSKKGRNWGNITGWAPKTLTVTINATKGTGFDSYAAKGMNRPAISYGSVGKGHLFGSAAKGHTEGIVGPRGNGGMTLTGELGPELVWLPSQNSSFMVGEGGPQLVPLPSDAVVYPAHITKNIVDQNRPVTEFGSMGSGSLPRYLTSGYTGGGAKTSSGITGSNSTKAGTEEDKWENDIDWLYNLLEDIDEVLRDREKLEKRYDRMLERRNASLSDLIELQKAQLANLETEKRLEEERYEKRQQEMREYLTENAGLTSSYGINYNWNDHTIEIDWKKIDAITDEKEGEKVNDMIARLEEIQDDMDEAEDSLMEIEELVDEIHQQGKDEYFDLEEQVIDALEQIAQNEIDRLSEINDSINDTDSKLLDSIQKAVDEQRRARENAETEEDLGDMRRRLAYLRQDTSGMNALEIKQLEEQLKDEEQAYSDSLVDQKLQEMQDQNDEASEQRERQINIMEEQLNYNRESGVFAKQARDLILDARDKLNAGVPIEKTSLYEVITEAENWQSVSWAKQLENWDELLVGAAQALAFLDDRENIDYMAEMQKWFKVLNDPNSSKDDKSLARSKIAILEKQRNAKILEEEMQNQYPTTGTTYTEIAYDSDSSNYMADIQSAFTDGNRAAIAKAEDLRNKKLDMMNRGNEKTNFLGAYDKAQATIEKGFDKKTDYSILLNEALKKGDFESALYYELLRDAKIKADPSLSSKYPTTNGSTTWDVYSKWTSTASQPTTPSEPAYGKVSDIWSKTFTITRQTTGEIVKAITGALKDMGLYSGSVSSSFTDESYKALRKFIGISSNNLNPFSFGPKTLEKFKAKGYKTGGLADYTGPAWLDGTPSKPEIVLNPRDTENFIQLKDILADLRGFKGKTKDSQKSGDTYYDVQINVEKLSNDYDVEQLASKIKKIIHKDSMYRNVNAINFLR